MKRKLKIIDYTFEIFILLITLIICIPLWIVFVNSFKPLDEALQLSLRFPVKFTYESYIIVFKESNALRALLNGIILATSTVVVSAIVTSMASFYFCRSSSKTSVNIYNLFVAGLIIPSAVIPTYLILFLLKLNNTYLGLILIFVTYTIPFSTFFYTGYIKTVPREMDEAAIIDGCSRLKLFFVIIFPLIKPATATILILNFLGVWNDVQSQLYFASADKWGMPMTVYNFYGKYMAKWNVIFADIIITIAPIFILYLFAQKYIVSGMTAGAIKA